MSQKNVVMECKLSVFYENCEVSEKELSNRITRALNFLVDEGLFTGNLDVEFNHLELTVFRQDPKERIGHDKKRTAEDA